MSASLIKEHTVHPMPTNMFLSFSLALAQPFFDSCLFFCLQLATTGNGGHLGLSELVQNLLALLHHGHLYEAGGTGSATLLPCFPHYPAFPGCSPIAWLHLIIAHQPIVHQIAFAPGPDTSAQVGTTWPSFCAQRLATLNLRQCVSPSCQFS